MTTNPQPRRDEEEAEKKDEAWELYEKLITANPIEAHDHIAQALQSARRDAVAGAREQMRQDAWDYINRSCPNDDCRCNVHSIEGFNKRFPKP